MSHQRIFSVLFAIAAWASAAAQKPPPKYPVITRLSCRQWADPTIPCCVGKKGDIFTFTLQIQNRERAKRVALRIEADDDPPRYGRVPGGFDVLEITPIKRTPLRVGEKVLVKLVIRLNSDQWQEIKVHTITEEGTLLQHACSDYLSFNDPAAIEAAKHLEPVKSLPRQTHPED